eukprot:c18175_g1_i2.p1 GENE.c18175_g1_i2~~c18175_g1_i2.p1  ORF type:complete len:679 (+),score=142.83 c18175_g1_i2:91-2127(+)
MESHMSHGHQHQCQDCLQNRALIDLMLRRIEALESTINLQSLANIFPPAQTADLQSELELVMENVCEAFVTDRPFPAFNISLRAVHTKGIFRQTDGWQVLIRLVNGYGVHVDDKLDDDQTKRPFLVEGIAEVSGLRFKDVSSSNGKYFKLQCEILNPASQAPHVRRGMSRKIEIKSCRCRTKAYETLSPTDPIGMLPGIGKQYAQRFTANNIATIADLARLSCDEDGQLERQRILELVRKEKGTLNETKLVEYIKFAQSVCPPRPSNQTAAQHQLFILGRQGTPPNNSPSSQLGMGVLDERPAKRLKTVDYATANAFGVSDLDQSYSFYNTGTGTMSLVDDATNLTNLTNLIDWDDGDSIRCHPDTDLSKETQSTDQWPVHSAIHAADDVALCKQAVEKAKEMNRVIDVENHQGLTPLMLACLLGRSSIVSYLCSLVEVQVNHVTEHGWSSLHFALLNQNHECARQLLACPKVDAQLSTNGGWTPFLIACAQGDAELAEMIWNSVAKSGPPKDFATSPYNLAAMSGDHATLELVCRLLAWDTERLSTSCESSSGLVAMPQVMDLTGEGDLANYPGASVAQLSCMHCAAYSGNPAIVQRLLDMKVSGKAVSDQGWTPLHMCVVQNHSECVPLICQADGIDVNARTSQGQTALDIAISMKHDTCVAQLKACGASEAQAEP